MWLAEVTSFFGKESAPNEAVHPEGCSAEVWSPGARTLDTVTQLVALTKKIPSCLQKKLAGHLFQWAF